LCKLLFKFVVHIEFLCFFIVGNQFGFVLFSILFSLFVELLVDFGILWFEIQSLGELLCVVFLERHRGGVVFAYDAVILLLLVGFQEPRVVDVRAWHEFEFGTPHADLVPILVVVAGLLEHVELEHCSWTQSGRGVPAAGVGVHVVVNEALLKPVGPPSPVLLQVHA